MLRDNRRHSKSRRNLAGFQTDIGNKYLSAHITTRAVKIINANAAKYDSVVLALGRLKLSLSVG